ARMALARDKLKVARVLFESEHYSDAVSKAYYAMFYASKALLFALGEDPHKHQGVVSMFGKKIVKVGLTHPRYGRTLAIAQQLREEADYSDEYRATRENAEDAIRDAEDFVNEAQETLKKIQVRGKQNVH
ncbi:MAG: HEPN domain-containing protein, partial [Anaerolineales bacterium]|nr:HEPN domain-containing protein [Anaerolineales bacterium]